MRYHAPLPVGSDVQSVRRAGALRTDFVARHVQAGWPVADAEARHTRWAAGELEIDPELDLHALAARVMHIRAGFTLVALRDLGHDGIGRGGPVFRAGVAYPVTAGAFSVPLRLPPAVTVCDDAGTLHTIDADQALEFRCETGEPFDDFSFEVQRLLRHAEGARLVFERCGGATGTDYREDAFRLAPGGQFHLMARADPATGGWQWGATPVLGERATMDQLRPCQSAADAVALIAGNPAPTAVPHSFHPPMTR